MSSMIFVHLPVPSAAALAVMMLAALCGTAAGQAFAGREKLRAHSQEFRQEVIRVTDGVYVAVGYSASNVILIQGDSGSIIVDTGSNPQEAREARAAFGDRLAAPVRAIIYTHGHPDHTGGACPWPTHQGRPGHTESPVVWPKAHLADAPESQRCFHSPEEARPGFLHPPGETKAVRHPPGADTSHRATK